MIVYEFCWLCTEGMTPVTIYDLNDRVSRDVWKGDMRDAALGEFRDYEVRSFDLTEDGLTINIDTSEE